MKLLLDAGCDPRIVDAERVNSILCEVSGPQSLAIVQALVAAGADVNFFKARDPGTPESGPARYHPLHLAFSNDQYDVAEFLITHGANINVEIREGVRMIDELRWRGRTRAVQMLLDRGAIDH